MVLMSPDGMKFHGFTLAVLPVALAEAVVEIDDERLLSADGVGMNQMVLDIFSLGRYTTCSRHM